jgi:outer membrane receptor protein involved in Fe transport
MAIPNFYNLSNTSDLYSSQYTENLRTFAFFGNLELEYDRWFYINFTGRNEWSSSFELDNNNFFYPSASTSIVFTELWDSRPKWLSFGKVRYSFAQVGIAPEPYNTATYFTNPTYTDGFTNGLTFPFGGINGFGISNTLGNPNLKPEILTGNEVGIYLNFLDDLFSLDVTYYNQKSSDILLFAPVAQSSGFSSQYTNAAEMVNQGWELQLRINPYRKGDFKWAVDMNWSTNKNEVTSLASGVEEVNLEAAFASIGSFAIVGEPIGVFYGTQWRRDANDRIIVGENGRPLIDSQTGNIGSWIPDWLAGIRNTFNYKDITFSFLLDFRKGGDIWNGTYARLNNVGRSADSEDRERTYIVDGVNLNGETNQVEISAQDYFRFVVGDAGGAAEEFVETVDWVRLRDVSLAYRLKFKENAQVSHMDFTFTAINLWLSTNYKGVDPETSLTGAGSNLNGFDYFNNPGVKTFLFGVSFSF